MPLTRAQANKKIRQDALREQLASQGHLQHVLDLCTKLAEAEQELDSLQVQRLKIVIDTKLKLISKYLPDIKAIELDSGGEGLIVHLSGTDANL